MEQVWPKSEQELLDILHEHENKKHDYGSVADSLVAVTVAMFNYFASKQGMTGFQAGWAGMRFLGITRGMKGPFAIIDGEKMLYPQYDLREDLEKWLEEWKPEIGKMAVEKLKQGTEFTHPDVLTRWKELAVHAPVDEGGPVQ